MPQRGPLSSCRCSSSALLVIAATALVEPVMGQGPSVPAGVLIAQNEFVTVRDVSWLRGDPAPGGDRHDVARIYLEGRPVGQVTFHAWRDRLPVEPGVSIVAAADVRAILIQLEDGAMTRHPNRTGYPPAFPRPGSTKVLENERVVVWDYTFTVNVPSPMHFHERDVVVVFLGEGTLASTTPEGAVTTRDHAHGVTMFNPGNRLHTETLIRGTCRVIVVELK